MRYLLIATLYLFFGILVVLYHYVTPNESEFVDKMVRLAREGSIVTVTSALQKQP